MTLSALANPADKFAAKRIKVIGLRQANSDILLVDEVIVEREQGTIYAKADERDTWHMLPIAELVGIEVELKDPKVSWFNDALTLPAIIAKLQVEQKKGA